MATTTLPIAAEDRATARRWLPELKAKIAAARERSEFPEVVARRETGRALATTKAVR